MHSKIYNLEEVNSRYINNANDENAIEERMFNNGQADYVTPSGFRAPRSRRRRRERYPRWPRWFPF